MVSSLLFSIVDSLLTDERHPDLRISAIRVLACLACRMSDKDKLPQLVHRLDQLLSTCSTSTRHSLHQLPGSSPHQHRLLDSRLTDQVGKNVSSSHGNLADQPSGSSGRLRYLGCSLFLERSCQRAARDWLLPTVAHWCLEASCLHTVLLSMWLGRLLPVSSKKQTVRSLEPYKQMLIIVGME
ncbi:unnamed protein product [Protopolystoma xenopodis]|uniref:Uncharacterized protein n=1 Tax=Protopolystoma xenopodis TaxID=117903 RepID=A0A448X336_9PLAT|nr:unnamed protein product [Protopolystoma xenopodis]